ncbi:MAG: apolipoprotein N-acyltransferase [Phycisphaerales bacterium]|nr:apolipoprotein N-acyltransferase [Phycisphaerales bacterium]
MPGSKVRADGSEVGTRGWVATFAWSIAGAVLFILAFPPHALWPLAFIAPAPTVWAAIRATTTRQALVGVGVPQFAMNLWLVHWTIPVTVVGYPLFALYFTAYVMLAAWLLRRTDRHPRLGRLPLAVTVPLVWVGIEAIRAALVLGGIPWFLLGHAVVEAPVLAQAADLGGTFLVSVIVATVAGAALDVARCRIGRSTVRRAVLVSASVVAVQASNLGYGFWRVGQTGGLTPGPTLLAIQTNLPQSNKMTSTADQKVEELRAFVMQTVDAFERALEAGRTVDLVVWPETMVPGLGFEPDIARAATAEGYDLISFFPEQVLALSDAMRTPMLVGSAAYVGTRFGETIEWDRQYNAAYLIDGAGVRARYDKVFLTPFGETMPVISRFEWLEQRLLALGASGMRFDLSAADEVTVMSVPFGGRDLVIGTPICFEASPSWVCRQMIYADGRKRGDLLVNLSNDGWFGDDDGARERMAQISRIRCIENRVPMVRAVNTGLSVGIDSRGFLVDVIGPGRYGQGRAAGAVLAPVTLDARSTLFGRTGDLVGIGLSCLASILAILTFRTPAPTIGRRTS